jgi:hypothetical protein
MDPNLWGPHYWFFLHTVAFHYPTHPTSIQKKMYHRLIHHFYEFIPNKSIATLYEKILQKNPVTPYLDTRDDFIQWMHHIHNKINERLQKPTITLQEHYDKFLIHFESKEKKLKRLWKQKAQIIITIFCVLVYIWIQ